MMATGTGNKLVVDVRGCTPTLRRDIVVAIVDKMLDLDAPDSLVVICEHEPVGLGYGIDLRKETRGKFEYFYDRRLDGAWVALIRRKAE